MEARRWKKTLPNCRAKSTARGNKARVGCTRGVTGTRDSGAVIAKEVQGIIICVCN